MNVDTREVRIYIYTDGRGAVHKIKRESDQSRGENRWISVHAETKINQNKIK